MFKEGSISSVWSWKVKSLKQIQSIGSRSVEKTVELNIEAVMKDEKDSEKKDQFLRLRDDEVDVLKSNEIAAKSI